jgi:L-glutamine:scyllo-inosose aminotransferase/L-glutamine:2-deoxy-scyllo-inosose/3-amino-2,3-dideoxy-scyllo-inosose aminotransferase
MHDDELALLGGTPVRTRPWPKWPRADSSTLRAVAEVLDSSRWAVSGPYDGRACFERRFSRAFADFHEVGYCTPTTSGTTALTIALQALGVGRGDEVLVPGLTWVACASAVVNIGAAPVLVDIDPQTLAMDPQKARAACTPRTAAILVVHPYCSVADLDAFTRLSAELGLPLIEDCAQAHGARWRDRPVGTFGAVGCFSMQQSKLLTSGEGGAVITGDPDLHRRLEQLRADGRNFTDTPQAGHLELIETATVQGRNACLSELQAAVLLDRLRHLEQENAVRAERAELLAQRLETVDGVEALPGDPRTTTRTYYNFVLRFDRDRFAGNSVDAIARALAAELGTLVNPVYTPLNRHRLLCPTAMPRGDISDAEWERLDVSRHHLPEADSARRDCATLTQPVLLDQEDGIDDIVTALHKLRQHAEKLRQTPQEASVMAF